MSDGTTDKAKGKLKQAAGDLTGDRRMHNEGKVDEAAGAVKDAIGDARDKAKALLHRDHDERDGDR